MQIDMYTKTPKRIHMQADMYTKMPNRVHVSTSVTPTIQTVSGLAMKINRHCLLI